MGSGWGSVRVVLEVWAYDAGVSLVYIQVRIRSTAAHLIWRCGTREKLG
jgi:hypothetical protein